MLGVNGGFMQLNHGKKAPLQRLRAGDGRVKVRFAKCREAPIKPLIERLSFIKSKTHWGAAFRFGYIKVPPADFALIAKAMAADSG